MYEMRFLDLLFRITVNKLNAKRLSPLPILFFKINYYFIIFIYFMFCEFCYSTSTTFQEKIQEKDISVIKEILYAIYKKLYIELFFYNDEYIRMVVDKTTGIV